MRSTKLARVLELQVLKEIIVSRTLLRHSYTALACTGPGRIRKTGEDEIYNLCVAPFECRRILRKVGVVIGKHVQVTLDPIDTVVETLLFM